MKKSVVEKTSEHILKLNQELDRQREGQKEFLQQQAEKRKVWLEKMTQGENGIRYSLPPISGKFGDCKIKKGASSREMACLKHQSQDNLETKSSRQ